jgi:hypothetical protein
VKFKDVPALRTPGVAPVVSLMVQVAQRILLVTQRAFFFERGTDRGDIVFTAAGRHDNTTVLGMEPRATLREIYREG